MSFARIHKANLVNFSILPLVFKNPDDYERVVQGSRFALKRVRALLQSGTVELLAVIDGVKIPLLLDISDKQRHELLAGGTLNAVKEGVV